MKKAVYRIKKGEEAKRNIKSQQLPTRDIEKPKATATKTPRKKKVN